MSIEIKALVKKYKDNIGKNLAGVLRSDLIIMGKVFSGEAMKSIAYDKQTGKVYSRVPWVRVIEYGRRPGSSLPLEKLEEWVRYSGKVDHDGTDKGIRAVALKIRWAITKDGIEPTRFVKVRLMKIEHRKEISIPSNVGNVEKEDI